MKKFIGIVAATLIMITFIGCDNSTPHQVDREKVDRQIEQLYEQQKEKNGNYVEYIYGEDGRKNGVIIYDSNIITTYDYTYPTKVSFDKETGEMIAYEPMITRSNR